jgi:hypothetical protein
LAELNDYKRYNQGVLIEEKDYSIYRVTNYANQFSLVLGCSTRGAFNLPITVVSPENFEEIFGKHDYNMEAKGSYFHRTVKQLLTQGPVHCVNLRLVDDSADKYNWVSVSTASDTPNHTPRTSALSKFYDRSSGYWKRSTDAVLDLAKETMPQAEVTPLHIVNQSATPVSVLMYKSEAKGFDICVEDWYNPKDKPSYLHPKDMVSDYLVTVIAVEGKWDNYKELSRHPKWHKYFDMSGIRKEKVSEFLIQNEVSLIRKWEASLIPYFKDYNDRDLFLPSVINSDVNETGIMVAFDVESVEADFRNGRIDLLGDNLSSNKRPMIDFLSYRRYLTDFVVIEETLIDQPGNTFGDAENTSTATRTTFFAEGYVHNCRMKKNILSATTNQRTYPLEVGDDAYAIVNGARVDLTGVVDYVSLHDVVKPGFKVAYVVVVSSEGVRFITSNMVSIDSNIRMPEIDPYADIVLGYYIIKEDLGGNHTTEMVGVSIDGDGFINPFGDEIVYREGAYGWQRELLFRDTATVRPRDYAQMRIHHMWSWLSRNIIEKKSVLVDMHDNKIRIDTVEDRQDRNDRWLVLSMQDRGYAHDGNTFNLYIKDYEFVSGKQRQLSSSDLKIDFDGTLGDESFLHEAYMKGEIHSGDPFFWSIGEEYDITFYKDGNTNMIVFNDGQMNAYETSRIIVQGTKLNDGIMTIIEQVTLNGKPAFIIEENIFPEFAESINVFNGADVNTLNIHWVDNRIKVEIVPYTDSIDEVYKRVFQNDNTVIWNKTLDILHNPESNLIGVDKYRYGKMLTIGDYLLCGKPDAAPTGSERTRNWTRIVDVYQSEETPHLLMVETDAPIHVRGENGFAQTNYMIPVHKWVGSLNFQVLDGFRVRKEALPDGTEERLQEILDIVAPETKLAKALVTERIPWRYLVDSFGGGLVNNSKRQLANLCMKKGMALGFLNMPSIRTFKRYEKADYATDGIFDTGKLISLNPRGKRNYSLTDIGQTHVTYLTPFVNIRENGRLFRVPPSAYVASLYMQKHNDESRNPWDIVAGVDRGRLRSIDGLEEIFNPEQLADLNMFRVTPITTYKNTFYHLHSENTAYNMVSTLNSIHSREVLIEIETMLQMELNRHHWKVYNAGVGLEIEQRANNILQYFKDNNAIYDFSNQFYVDDELLDNQSALLNTAVEIVKGMASIKLSVTIMATNAI